MIPIVLLRHGHHDIARPEPLHATPEARPQFGRWLGALAGARYRAPGGDPVLAGRDGAGRPALHVVFVRFDLVELQGVSIVIVVAPVEIRGRRCGQSSGGGGGRDWWFWVWVWVCPGVPGWRVLPACHDVATRGIDDGG